MIIALHYLAWFFGTIAALIIGLVLGVWTMTSRRRKPSKGGGFSSAVFMAELGFNTREAQLLQSFKDETNRKKPSRPGDPPEPTDD
jgi:hypothetical protein